jgi:hypothetical protein
MYSLDHLRPTGGLQKWCIIVAEGFQVAVLGATGVATSTCDLATAHHHSHWRCWT